MSDANKQSVEHCKYRHEWQSNNGQINCSTCGHLPTAKEMQEAESILHLREVLKPGDTVYTVIRHVSRSGMSRGIDCYYMSGNTPIWITGYVGHAIGSPQSRKDWEQSNGLRVSGCGMDMGFHVVNSLSYVIFPTYKCLGENAEPGCPSNYHVNHRDTVQCEGLPTWRVYYRDLDGQVQKLPEVYQSREQAEQRASILGPDATLPDGDSVSCDYLHCWRSETVKLPDLDVDLEDGTKVPVLQGKAYTIKHEDGTEVICPTCKGHGRYPNPEGLERWDLMHKDGYALRHKWL